MTVKSPKSITSSYCFFVKFFNHLARLCTLRVSNIFRTVRPFGSVSDPIGLVLNMLYAYEASGASQQIGSSYCLGLRIDATATLQSVGL